MAQIFIANIGNRDVQIEINGKSYPLNYGVETPTTPANPELANLLGLEMKQIGVRPLGEWLLKGIDLSLIGNSFLDELLEAENLNKHKDKLRLPILQPVFEQLSNRKFDKVFLVATNQPESTPERFRNGDTFFAARIIVCLIQHKPFFNGATFEYIEIENNPHEYDTTYAFLGEQLRAEIGSEDAVVAVLSGGIPAINAGIRDHVLGICGKRTALMQAIESSRPDEPGRAEFISSWPFRRDQILRQVRELLTKSYDYAGVLNLLEDEGFAFDEIRAVLNHAYKRSQFDWEAAAQALNNFININSRIKQWYDEVDNQGARDRLREVVECTELALRRNHWRDFVVLSETFVENAWKILAKDILGLSYQNTHVLINQINQSLRQHVGSYKGVETGKGSYKINKAFSRAIVEYESNHDETIQEDSEGISCIDESVYELRNLVVHEMGSLSREELEAKTRQNYIGRDPLNAIIEEMRNLIAGFSYPAEEPSFIYHEINAFVLESLQSKEY